MSRFEDLRNAKLKQLAECKPFVAASLCLVRRRCGNPNCKCARGEPHQAHVLTLKTKGKTQTLHVPIALLEDVQAWVKEHKRIKKLLREISNLGLNIIRRHVPASRAEKRSKKKFRL